MLSLVPTAYAAAPAVTMEATPASNVNVGDEVVVSVKIPAVTGEINKAYAAGVKFTYDKNAFEVKSFTPPSYNGTDSNGNNDAGGTISCTYVGAAGANTIDCSSAVTVSATFKVLAAATPGATYDFALDTDSTQLLFYDEENYSDIALVTVPSGTKATVTIAKAPITTISATVDDPERGEPLDTDATIPADAQYTVSDVKWLDGTNTATGNASPSRDYTVEITLLAKTGEKFAAQSALALPDGYTIKSRSETALVIKRTFPTTSSKAQLTGKLTISGTANVGSTLTATLTDSNETDSNKLTYQWYRGTTTITGATGTTYKLVKEDYEKNITVKVTATDASQYAGTVEATAVTVGCNHIGGTATCQQKAKCTTCENYYGETVSHDFTGVTTWGYKGAAGHAHLCKNCNVAQDALQPHTHGDPATLTASQTCTECGYEIAPKLKAITNIAFKMNGYEFASKITDLKVTTTSTEVNFDPTTYGEDYIVVLEEDADGNGPVDVPAGSTLTFDNDTVYYVMPAFSPKDGYAFASNLKVTLDGKEASVVLDDEDETGAKVAMFVLRDQDPADPEITRELPFTLVVEKGGTADIPKEIFKIESFLPEGETSTVKGEGIITTTNKDTYTYTGTMKFEGTKSAMLDYATKTFYVRMVDGGKEGWAYDETVWQVKPGPMGNDGKMTLTFNKVTVTQKEDGSVEYTVDQETADKLSFKVIYTAEAPTVPVPSYKDDTIRRQDANTTTGTTTVDKKPSVKSPTTGDAGIALYAALGVLSLTGGAWVVGKKRK